ncbi:MltF family protein [Marinigracilibium pacificum]|uniref:Transporter substrate-binding domain-containing protein n=1 Tax=Marinigracilibium pacificum TaxID=2729599 RepID=A0A848J265_9BACT|nr:transporter substrate-binding domain-containing protein [Marinigracilibium pacificum]NMM49595.1 transporter substrate-binding domain-containing protein [Marinigracilibium pacificum]
MGKYVLFLPVLFLFITFSSCRQSGIEQKDVAKDSANTIQVVNLDLPTIKRRGVLRAVVDNSSTGYFIYRGKPMGYEYELLQRLADDLDIHLEIKISPSIEEAFKMLNSGKVDIIAYNLSITKERKKYATFTEYHSIERQVLVQRKPDNWRKLKWHQTENILVRDPLDLIGKEVYVRNSSAYLSRLQNLSEELGDDIFIVEADKDMTTEDLIRKVAEGEIDYTVADENMAKVNATYYPDIDVETAVSFPQRISWAVRKNADSLESSINQWVRKMRKTNDYHVIYRKYFENPKYNRKWVKSDYASFSSEKLSPFDQSFKENAVKMGWDWLLLASVAYQESRFDPNVTSWAGAHGLFQLLPETAKEYGVTNTFDPEQNIKAGASHLKWLDEYWAERVSDSTERKKFVLASYNIGQGHILDARRLARKYGADPQKWEDNVEKYLLLKSQQDYYQDKVVKYGYCRGTETVAYVREIMKLYEQYQLIYNDSSKLQRVARLD